MGSRMSSIKPLGSYELALDWRGQQADMTLRTVRGAAAAERAPAR
jgi:general secretion pathway protein N